MTLVIELKPGTADRETSARFSATMDDLSGSVIADMGLLSFGVIGIVAGLLKPLQHSDLDAELLAHLQKRYVPLVDTIINN